MSVGMNIMTNDLLNGLKELLFEIYSAGFEAGMSHKDIVTSYNDFYDDILRRFNS